MTEHELKELEKALNQYIEYVEHEFHARVSAWSIKYEEREMYEVITGLLSRQTALVVEMAKAPTVWNGHIGPIILRVMVDGYITLSWIFEDPLVRSRQFITYGLGQAKLNMEHRKRQIIDEGGDPDKDKVIQLNKMWIDSQQFDFLTEVNVGNWSGKTPRQMAEEAGCLGLYNYAYNPFSACVHNMWHHIEPFNLAYCGNDLHGYHRMPRIKKKVWDFDFFYRAAKYAQKTFLLFDAKKGIKIEAKPAFDFLCHWLAEENNKPTSEKSEQTEE